MARDHSNGGSNRPEKHLDTLRVIVMDNLEIIKVVPKSCLPHGNLKVILKL